MSLSSVKRLGNEIATLESQSTKLIPKDKYYIVKAIVTFSPENTLPTKPKKLLKTLTGHASYLKGLAEEMLMSEPQPLVSWSNSSVLLLLIPHPEDDAEHDEGGDISKLISKYACLYTIRLMQDGVEVPFDMRVSIIELDTQIAVVTYLSWIIFEQMQILLSKLSDGKITQKELNFRTIDEMKGLLESGEVKYDAIPPNIRHGVVLKLQQRKNSIVTKELSEAYDSREVSKYISFIFN